jgi:hypothetical protein
VRWAWDGDFDMFLSMVMSVSVDVVWWTELRLKWMGWDGVESRFVSTYTYTYCHT